MMWYSHIRKMILTLNKKKTPRFNVFKMQLRISKIMWKFKTKKVFKALGQKQYINCYRF